jgi:hypothetical protein
VNFPKLFPRYPHPLIIVVALLLTILGGCIVAFAQETNVVDYNGGVSRLIIVGTNTSPAFPLDPTGIFSWLSVKAPWIVNMLVFIGTLRVIFKPLTAIFTTYVAATPSTTDDQFVEKAIASPWYRGVAWLLDFATSVKVGPAKAVEDPTPVKTQEQADAIKNETPPK